MSTARNAASCILVAPKAEVDLSGYNKVILLDGVQIRLPALSGRSVEIAADATVPEYLRGLSCKREELLKLFATLAANENGIEGACAEEVAKNNNLALLKLRYTLR